MGEQIELDGTVKNARGRKGEKKSEKPFLNEEKKRMKSDARIDRGKQGRGISPSTKKQGGSDRKKGNTYVKNGNPEDKRGESPGSQKKMGKPGKGGENRHSVHVEKGVH